jgi:hypothetical protein
MGGHQKTRYGNCDLICSEDFSPGKHYLSKSETNLLASDPTPFLNGPNPFCVTESLVMGGHPNNNTSLELLSMLREIFHA